MNLKQLTYFIAVAEELHFGRAAERLGMAQPPLSRQIKQIEDDLGAVLFNRGRRAVSLTQAGERLLERGRTLMRDIDDMKLEVRRLGEGAEGRLRIGFVGSSTFGILPTIVKSFRANFPDVILTLSPMNNAQLYRRLVGREIDVAFARPALTDAEFRTVQLGDEPLVAATPDSVATARPGRVTLDELRGMNFILYPEYPRPSYADLVLDSCAAHGLDPDRKLFTMDLQTALRLVAIGEGVCIVPASVGSAQRNGIRFNAIEPEIGQTSLALNYRLDEQGPHVRAFVKIAQAVARRSF
ncbi:LysR substrate-binding domain-containing protein [Salipiger mucosus]|uniref:Aromatic hydrocarbon utilization transcriptional regulator CatR (LysR family) n=1 Tax=Salipiger mucosus DSM 16094 TaxID=1123237 RepID=S9Q9H8_9RHOB|nr:LysR substrate-binding domain-containing protein [Salipiger mucosus]EPX76612.1 Aromatic hydrocarbon utilization transcriptional regulator CatR (LysR family) [Salipiger mucosus DSM 16094]